LGKPLSGLRCPIFGNDDRRVISFPGSADHLITHLADFAYCRKAYVVVPALDSKLFDGEAGGRLDRKAVRPIGMFVTSPQKRSLRERGLATADDECFIWDDIAFRHE
jgi:hypothetical protein